MNTSAVQSYTVQPLGEPPHGRKIRIREQIEHDAVVGYAHILIRRDVAATVLGMCVASLEIGGASISQVLKNGTVDARAEIVLGLNMPAPRGTIIQIFTQDDSGDGKVDYLVEVGYSTIPEPKPVKKE